MESMTGQGVSVPFILTQLRNLSMGKMIVGNVRLPEAWTDLLRHCPGATRRWSLHGLSPSKLTAPLSRRPPTYEPVDRDAAAELSRLGLCLRCFRSTIRRRVHERSCEQ